MSTIVTQQLEPDALKARIEQKPVELRFGQGICPFEFDGVLRG